MRMSLWVFAACVSVAVTAGCAAGPAVGQEVVKNFFNDTKDGLVFVTDEWSVRSQRGRGWVSLKVGGAEFLHSTADRGGFAFRKGEKLMTYFPDQNNISHDRKVGRIGGVADGIYLLRISPSWTRGEFELYAGHNDRADHELVMYLGDDVAMVRLGSVGREDRTWLRQIVRPGHKGLVKSPGAVIVHKTGCALVIQADCRVGTVKDPDGKDRLAIVFDTKGFAANSFPCIVEPQKRAENFVMTPQFDVTSSDDPKENVLGATMGVLNPVYGRDTKLDFNIEFGWLGDGPFDGSVELEVVHALGKRHLYERKELKGVKPDDKGRVRVHFDPKFTMPGVSEVWGRIVDASGRLIWVNRYRMAYDWEHYKPEILVQPDMKQFWDATLKELRKVPLEPKTRRVFEDHPVLEIYEVTFNSWGGKRIYAMLFVPKGAKRPLPAIVGSHPGTKGYGIRKDNKGRFGSRIRQDLRCVTITPLIRGHKPDAKDIPFNHPWWGPLESRDDYVARAWYCAMVRSIDYLATRPDLVDMKRIVARGGSQGGALALVTAALDDRVAYCFADCPANCQPQEIMRYYGSFGPSRGVIPEGKTLADVDKLLSYYNPANFCPWIRCPTYVGSNIGDLTVHSMGPLAAYHNLTALKADRKDFYPGFTHMHGSGAGLGRKQREILEKIAGPPIDAKKRMEEAR